MASIDQLDRFPRVRLLEGPTPIQRLPRVEAALGPEHGIKLFVKRDDLMGLGGGGNKLRKLEFLLGEAQARGADTIVTVGGRQSNHARLTAAAARLGLRCELVLVRMVPRHDPDYVDNGNILLDDLFGARVHDLPAGSDALAFAEARAAELKAEGRSAYVASIGGSSPIGCLGYAACAAEIASQSRELGLTFSRVVVPNGSSGTHAGLAAGFEALGTGAAIVKSFAVLAKADVAQATTLEKARATAALLGLASPIGADAIEVAGDQLGEGYGMPTPTMVSAVRLAASREGLLLDPVYSGKAFAGVLADIQSGRIAAGQSLLFIMTGGAPSLFSYRSAF
ncbi:MAG TPA: D-cysteine desulfhydrase family protein [Aliidongia sp.]|nr:D-cysteine desulfhydrase family protein [Aliidongia sp.]